MPIRLTEAAVTLSVLHLRFFIVHRNIKSGECQDARVVTVVTCPVLESDVEVEVGER